MLVFFRQDLNVMLKSLRHVRGTLFDQRNVKAFKQSLILEEQQDKFTEK
jgi:hypothetical protein